MSERILVVGGTGMIGSHIAGRLAARGDEVSVMSRGASSDRDPQAIAGMPRVVGDYTAADFSTAALEGFDALVFAAGNDIRHVAEGDDDDTFWRSVQSEGVPAFAARAKQAGVGRFVQIGSYYHQLHPEWAETNPYVAARKAADEGTLALAGEGFSPITLNPPSIVGVVPEKAPRHYRKMLAWVRGELDAPELFAPKGGTNYLSVRSLAEAVEGALARGEAGRAYLIGDANLHYNEYFQLLADAAGGDQMIAERDEWHPFLPDRFIVQGRGQVISYEPDAAEAELLGYQRGDVRRAVEEIVEFATR
jgi:dihydroflavonol-4-reductase